MRCIETTKLVRARHLRWAFRKIFFNFLTYYQPLSRPNGL
jgi:hypothetical protein